MTDLRTVCCACQRVIRDGVLDAEGRVSHGLCRECCDRLYPDAAVDREPAAAQQVVVR